MAITFTLLNQCEHKTGNGPPAIMELCKFNDLTFVLFFTHIVIQTLITEVSRNFYTYHKLNGAEKPPPSLKKLC